MIERRLAVRAAVTRGADVPVLPCTVADVLVSAWLRDPHLWRPEGDS